MVLFLTLTILMLIFCLVVNFAKSEDGWLATWTLVGICLSCFILGILFYERLENTNRVKHNNEIINKYKSGNYSLEVKVQGDKVDTLYIFK